VTLSFRAYLEKLDPVQRLQVIDNVTQLAKELFTHNSDIDPKHAIEFAEQFYLAQLNWLNDNNELPTQNPQT
jgi:hypothetical protein